MAKERLLFGYKDILEDRRRNDDAVQYYKRYWNPQPVYKTKEIITPHDLKRIALESRRMDVILDELSATLNRDKNDLKKEIAKMLDEIGLDRTMFTIRWLCIITTKVLCSLCYKIFVNESNFFYIKSIIGPNPVVFVPTHRSYADFVLFSYICHLYDIEIPAMATGINLSSMAIFGQFVRGTHGFFIRRSFLSDKVYSAAFRQYVRTLICNYHAPIGFFIEGTRSRTGKSLPAKLGLLSMIMEPFFDGEIPDITFVPVSISFERAVEENLFTYEALGVPKPKETMLGLVKALNSLNEKYGNVYINIGRPFSALEYCGSYSKSRNKDSAGQLSDEENKLVQRLGKDIIHKQQMGMITTTVQLMYTAIMVSLHNSKPMVLDEVEEFIVWLSSVVKSFGGSSFDYNSENVKVELEESMSVHKHTIHVDRNKYVRLIKSLPFPITNEIRRKMKGHQLSEKTMSSVMPLFLLQFYINGLLHWFISHVIIYHIVLKSPAIKVELWEQYQRMRLILKYEFPTRDDLISEFEKTLDDLLSSNVLRIDNVNKNYTFVLGSNEKLQFLLEILFWPTLSCIHKMSIAICDEKVLEEKKMIKSIQETFEWQMLNKEDVHPYCLSLDCIQFCIQGFVAVNALKKQTIEKTVTYAVNSTEMSKLSMWITSLLPKRDIRFCLDNSVMIEPNLLSRL